MFINDLVIHVRDHLALAASALAVALVLGIPLGAAIAGSRALRGPALGAVYVARVVPSLAVLAIMLPLVGIGFWPAAAVISLIFAGYHVTNAGESPART